MLMKPNDTPLQKINDPIISGWGINLFMFRLDLNHPTISGNKWFKLKYNLEEARKLNKTTLLTFGGAFSNHLAATAAAGKEFGFNTIGIIRGDEHSALNPTLKFSSDNGMVLRYISREAYRDKYEISFIDSLREEFGDFYLLPEGGSNDLAIKGCMEILKNENVGNFDYVCVSCGTGATLAGLILSLNTRQQAIGFSSLKGGEFLENEVNKYVNPSCKTINNWHINHDYHFGRYAKVTNELIHFVKLFEQQNQIPLDYIYTGKMMFGIYDLIKKGNFLMGETIIAIHTGGLQGNAKISSMIK